MLQKAPYLTKPSPSDQLQFVLQPVKCIDLGDTHQRYTFLVNKWFGKLHILKAIDPHETTGEVVVCGPGG